MKANTLLRYSFLLSTIFFFIGVILKLQHYHETYSTFILGFVFYFIYAALALREIWISMRVNRDEKIIWTVLFILMPIITGFFYTTLGRRHVIDKNLF